MVLMAAYTDPCYNRTVSFSAANQYLRESCCERRGVIWNIQHTYRLMFFSLGRFFDKSTRDSILSPTSDSPLGNVLDAQCMTLTSGSVLITV